jgi:hypothetical protein
VAVDRVLVVRRPNQGFVTSVDPTGVAGHGIHDLLLREEFF